MRRLLLPLLLLAAQFVQAQAVTATTGGTVPRAAEGYRAEIVRQGRMVWGLDAPTASFAAQIQQESAWRADARSRVGALGLAQFMPATAKWIGGIDTELAAVAPMNPTWAIRALIVYDKWLYERVRAVNACEKMAFAMSAYNGGLGWVLKRKAKSAEPLVCFGKTCNVNPGIHPANQKENQEYPVRILLRNEPVYAATGRWGKGACYVG